MNKQKNLQSTQSGAAAIVGISIIAVLLLIAVTMAFLALSNSDSKTSFTADPISVKADDLLTQGKSNNELLIDQRIIKAGLDRDDDQRAAAMKALDDEAQPVGDGVTAATVVESDRLSNLQTEYISEADRRLELLDTASKAVDQLEPAQKPAVNKVIGDEITALTGLKAKAAAETTKEAFLADRTELEKQYVNFIFAYSQIYLLIWANDQTVLDEKVNVLGGKFQERLNEASNDGQSTASAQTQLNSYQSNKTQAKTQTADALKAIMAVKVGSYEANRAVLKTYHDKLSSSHGQVKNALDTASTISQALATYK